jgi:hypothetical protein
MKFAIICATLHTRVSIKCEYFIFEFMPPFKLKKHISFYVLGVVLCFLLFFHIKLP